MTEQVNLYDLDVLSDLSAEEVAQLIAVTPLLVNEEEYFSRCAACGQAVDMRRLAQILHHLEPEHRPLAIALH